MQQYISLVPYWGLVDSLSGWWWPNGHPYSCQSLPLLVGPGSFCAPAERREENPNWESKTWKPGSCPKSWKIGRCQMDGFKGSFGSPGCSRTPSAHARQIIRSMEKMSNSFPTATWDSSFRAKEGRPPKVPERSQWSRLSANRGLKLCKPGLAPSFAGSSGECCSEPKSSRLYIAGAPPLPINDHVHWDHVKNEPVAIPRKGRFQIMLEISWPSASRKCV